MNRLKDEGGFLILVLAVIGALVIIGAVLHHI